MGKHILTLMMCDAKVLRLLTECSASMVHMASRSRCAWNCRQFPAAQSYGLASIGSLEVSVTAQCFPTSYSWHICSSAYGAPQHCMENVLHTNLDRP